MRRYVYQAVWTVDVEDDVDPRRVFGPGRAGRVLQAVVGRLLDDGMPRVRLTVGAVSVVCEPQTSQMAPSQPSRSDSSVTSG